MRTGPQRRSSKHKYLTRTIAILRELKHFWWFTWPKLRVLRRQKGEYALKDNRPHLGGYLRLECPTNSAHVRPNVRSECRKTHGVLCIRTLWELGVDHVRADLAGAGESQNGAVR
jgi:hypothetical protein